MSITHCPYPRANAVVILIALLIFTVFSADAQSANSNLVVFSDVGEEQHNDIYIMNADGNNLMQLTNNPANDTEPRLSPDGSKIVFRSERDGNDEIYTMNPSGNNVTRLTTNSGYDASPSWSADGTKIAYVSGTTNHLDIYIMNADGTNPINVTNSVANEVNVKWSPDGSKIAFISNRGGLYQLYTILPDGSGYSRLTNTTNDLGSKYYWSPNGSMIAFRDGQIYRINTDGTGFAKITSEGDVGSFCWLTNNQLLFNDTVSGWISINSDGSNRTVVNLNWPDGAGGLAFPANWQPPVIVANSPPTANAGNDQTIQTNNSQPVAVTLSGSGSDSDGQVISYDWYENNIQLATGYPVVVTLDLGIHLITLIVRDNRGVAASDQVSISVVN